MPSKSKTGHRTTPKVASQPPRSAEQPRPAPGRAAHTRGRAGPGHDRTTGAGRGGASAGAEAGKQGSVRDMIKRLDASRGGGARSVSPTKRPRRNSPSGSASSGSTVSDSELDQPLTELTLRSVMQSMTQQIRGDIASEFAAIRDELGKMSSRIYELEKHVEQRDKFIDEMESRLQDGESRVEELEEEVERLNSEHKRRDLIFSGSAVPAPPSQAWTEDVKATTMALLARCLPDVKVTSSDIEECFRVSRGKRILCRFRRSGKGSVRDELYERRFSARRVGPVAAGSGGPGVTSAPPAPAAASRAGPTSDGPTPGGGAGTGLSSAAATLADSERAATALQLYVSENLTRRKQEIFQALLTEKRANRLYTVFTKNGEVFCKTMQFGQKVRVDSMGKIPHVLRG